MSTSWRSFLSRTSIVWKNAVGCAVAWKIASLAGSKHPYLAPLAVILCLQVTIDKTLRHAWQRFVGTVIGVLLTSYLAQFLGIHAWSIGLVILVGTALAKGLKLGNQVIHQVALSVLLVLVFENKSSQYAFDRILETVIGAAVAVLLNLLVIPPNLTDQATSSVAQLKNQLINTFHQASAWLEKDCPWPEGQQLKKATQELLPALHHTQKEIENAAKSLKYNLLSQRPNQRLQRCELEFKMLQQGISHFTNMMPTLLDWASSKLMTQQDRVIWSSQFHNFAEAFASNNPMAISLPTLPPEARTYRYVVAIHQEAGKMMLPVQ